MSYFYKDSEVKCLPYLITKRDVQGSSVAFEGTQNLLFGCIPAFS